MAALAQALPRPDLTAPAAVDIPHPNRPLPESGKPSELPRRRPPEVAPDGDLGAARRPREVVVAASEPALAAAVAVDRVHDSFPYERDAASVGDQTGPLPRPSLSSPLPSVLITYKSGSAVFARSVPSLPLTYGNGGRVNAIWLPSGDQESSGERAPPVLVWVSVRLPVPSGCTR